MNHTTVAAATIPLTEFQPMADIVDSLKRLERIGSEHSKTVEKIIEAAKELEKTIVGLFSGDKSAVHITANLGRNSPAYTIQPHDPKLMGGGRRLLRNNGWVAGNRALALAFAEDVSNGLLEVIARHLEAQESENANALTTLTEALKKLKQ